VIPLYYLTVCGYGGIWHLTDVKWLQFAKGTFDSLGVVIDDSKGLDLVVGQKTAVTWIKYTNGNALADKYISLLDQFSYHDHAYMHGPTKDSKGNYYITLNVQTGRDLYKPNGSTMGTTGGYRAWTIQLTAERKHTFWANGMRSLEVSEDDQSLNCARCFMQNRSIAITTVDKSFA
jgi:hypothetical protein